MEKDMSLTKRIVLTVIALIGFLTSVKLSLIYIDANFNPYALSSFCSINELIDCDGVAKTTHSQFLGIPLAFWGLFLYFIFLFLTYSDKLYEIKIANFRPFGFAEVFKNPQSYICALGIISFCISMSLAFISIFEIHKICILCMFTYILNLIIGLYAKPEHENYIQVFKTSFVDFIDALKTKCYGVAFFIAVIITAALLTFTTVTDILAPQVKLQKEFAAYSKPDGSIYNVSGNIIGNKNAKVIVHIYTDYQCPYCFVLNTMTMRAVKELDNVKFIHHHLPLDNECNYTMKSPMHKGSCLLAKYAIAAGKQGKYWAMNNMLFEKEVKNEEALLAEAKKFGFDIVKLENDAHSDEVAQEIRKEIEESVRYNIDGTPAYRINFESHVGIIPYEKFKQKLIDAGAKERK